MDRERFQIAANIVRHLSVLVALLHRAWLVKARFVALVVDASKDENVENQQGTADGDCNAESGRISSKSILRGRTRRCIVLVHVVIDWR